MKCKNLFISTSLILYSIFLSSPLIAKNENFESLRMAGNIENSRLLYLVKKSSLQKAQLQIETYSENSWGQNQGLLGGLATQHREYIRSSKIVPKLVPLDNLVSKRNIHKEIYETLKEQLSGIDWIKLLGADYKEIYDYPGNKNDFSIKKYAQSINESHLFVVHASVAITPHFELVEFSASLELYELNRKKILGTWEYIHQSEMHGTFKTRDAGLVQMEAVERERQILLKKLETTKINKKRFPLYSQFLKKIHRLAGPTRTIKKPDNTDGMFWLNEGEDEFVNIINRGINDLPDMIIKSFSYTGKIDTASISLADRFWKKHQFPDSIGTIPVFLIEESRDRNYVKLLPEKLRKTQNTEYYFSYDKRYPILSKSDRRVYLGVKPDENIPSELIAWRGKNLYKRKTDFFQVSEKQAAELLTLTKKAKENEYGSNSELKVLPLFAADGKYFFPVEIKKRYLKVSLEGYYVDGMTGVVEYRKSSRMVTGKSKKIPKNAFSNIEVLSKTK